MCFKDIAFMRMHDIQLYDSLKDMPFFIYMLHNYNWGHIKVVEPFYMI